jgi:hypothetical protein
VFCVSCAENSHPYLLITSLTLLLLTYVYFYFCLHLIRHCHCVNFDSADHSLPPLITLPFHPPFPLFHTFTITSLHVCHIPTFFFPCPACQYITLLSIPSLAPYAPTPCPHSPPLPSSPPHPLHLLTHYTSSPSTPSLALYPLHPPSPYSHSMSSLILHYPLPHAPQAL